MLQASGGATTALAAFGTVALGPMRVGQGAVIAPGYQLEVVYAELLCGRVSP
ncbi:MULTISPECIES: hypothetical protein [Ferrimicrobium]|uniref:Uncharacterized protein n=1 Tax=Ferrimicrobium acidiphilum TaxID=121039 RepID=A0ABV3Y3W9_9ACTN|nr:hypothetical protein [Ferrimicrobium sp.]